jgi:hypothetical protein
MRPFAQGVPTRFVDLDPVVASRFLDIREGDIAISVRDVLHLVEPSKGVLDVPGVGQRLFALLREGIRALRQ